MNSPLASPQATRAVLSRHGHSAKHKLGQNFLVSDEVVGRILGLADLSAEDVVLEVGPGLGTLSLALLPRVSHLIAVEQDRALPPVLAETTADFAERFTLLQGNALDIDQVALQEVLPEGISLPNRFVANLPYNVAATLILKYFAELPMLEEATVMVQSEVADRICASAGSKTYGAYTVKLLLYAKVGGRFQVPPDSFMPAPHVTSSVIKLIRHDLGLSLEERAKVSQVVDAAFALRRKTIRNSMRSNAFSVEELDTAFGKTGIDPNRRAETLLLEEFIALAGSLTF